MLIIMHRGIGSTMARNPKGGRPPKPARLRRTRRLQLLLTAAEHRALNEYAVRQEMTASEIIRGCIRSLLGDQNAKGGLR
jgi:hypothetical protein